MRASVVPHPELELLTEKVTREGRPDAWHSFVNTRSGMLRQTAIHQNPRAVSDFEDGTRRE